VTPLHLCPPSHDAIADTTDRTPAPTPTLMRAATLGELLVAMQSELEAVREAAWAACYARHYDVVRANAAYVLRSISWLAEPREVAADVASDVFAALPLAVRHYREEGRAGWWLKQITIRTALRKKETLTGRWVSGRTAGKEPARAGRQYVSFDETSDRVAARLDAAEPEELLELNRRREALRASADAQQRRWDAFLDLYVAGYEFAEIGARLGLTAGTARNWLCQIRKHLAQARVEGRSAAA
jgi:RNA polymerase sigma factor (sigma-70 family)